MGATEPESNSPASGEPTPELTDLLVIYHQHLVDQSRLSHGAVAFETPPCALNADSSLDDSVLADPDVAKELAQLEDCLWQLEQMRRVEAADSSSPQQGSEQQVLPNLGERRLGRFQLLRELGRGGLGVVYLAHDPILNRRVALKIPRSEALLTSELHQRFQREAQAAARLTHPNIVPVYEIGEAGPLVYIASAYIAGQSLAEWLRSQSGPVGIATAARMVMPLADAMHYAHSQGVLHRDLKPANILLEPAQEVTSAGSEDAYDFTAGKIADFGLAKLLDLAGSDTRSDAILGTPAYMSPEQAEAKQSEIGPATDIYSLGVILYELLLGRPPYRGDSDAATLVQVMQGRLSDMRKARPEISPDLAAICLKCLERNPADRYKTAGELAADLRRYLRGESTLARPLASWQRLGRWTKRNPILAGLSFVSLALLMSVAVVSTVAAVRIRSARDEARQTALAERTARELADKALLAEQAALQEAQAAEKRTAEARVAADQQAANATQISNMLTELFTTADPLGMARLGLRDPDEVGMDLPLSELLSRGATHARQTLAEQPLVQAALLDTLGAVYSNLGQLAEAEPLIRESYELRRKNGASEADLATSKLHVGNLQRWQGKHAEAEPLLREVLATRMQLFGHDDLGVAEARIALAWLLSERAMLKHADPSGHNARESGVLIEQALATQLKNLGPDHREVGLNMSFAALAKWHRGDIAAAHELLADAVNVLSRQEGGEGLLTAMTHAAQGLIARASGDLPTAIDSYRNAISAAREPLGEKHFITIMLMAELAGSLRDSGHMSEGEVVIRDAIKAAFKIYPDGHPMMVDPLRQLADIVESRGDYAEAEELAKQNSEFELRWMGSRSEYDLRTIVWLRINAGRYAEALELLKHPDISPRWVLIAKADIAYAVGQTELAEKLACYLSDYRERYHVADGELKGIQLRWGLASYVNKAKEVETKRFVQNLWLSRPTNLAPNNPHIAYHTLAVARILIEEGRHAEVESELQQTLDYVRANMIPGCWCIGYAESVAGQLRAAQGNVPEAESLMLRGLEDLRKSRGEHHWLTREAVGALVKLYQQTGRAADAIPYAPLLNLPEPVQIEYELLAP